ncbi:hypothetical protein V6N13_148518 [Hibiscus sabdariffa]|uniref:Uncharacterized protein n=1 Tax=Hibiscus sabdariffa TaxID=183260 RepID=A0ABR2TYQ1_9ROSI
MSKMGVVVAIVHTMNLAQNFFYAYVKVWHKFALVTMIRLPQINLPNFHVFPPIIREYNLSYDVATKNVPAKSINSPANVSTTSDLPRLKASSKIIRDYLFDLNFPTDVDATPIAVAKEEVLVEDVDEEENDSFSAEKSTTVNNVEKELIASKNGDATTEEPEM